MNQQELNGFICMFDIFGAYSKRNQKFHWNNNITNIFTLQAYDSIMCGYYCTGFIDFMIKGKSLLEYTNLFSPDDYEKNDKIIL